MTDPNKKFDARRLPAVGAGSPRFAPTDPFCRHSRATLRFSFLDGSRWSAAYGRHVTKVFDPYTSKISGGRNSIP